MRLVVAGPLHMNKGDLVAGRYRLLNPIGAGAMGTVWAARHELLGRDFALKLESVSPYAGPEVRARFLREAKIVGKLRHPNVVDVADVGEVAPGAGLYLAMELLQGQSLAERIAEHGPVDTLEALAITSDVCQGLAAAHASGVIHRDVKPENIFLARTPSGDIVPKLLDFGISKANEPTAELITLDGQLFGTPAYMSPEQALGELDTDHRTDVWSLGVVLYEMLTGRRPFAAPSYPALLPLIAEKDFTPLPPTLRADVQAIIARCLAKSKADRFPSAEAVRRAVDDVRGAVTGGGVAFPAVAPPSSVSPRRSQPAFVDTSATSPSTLETRSEEPRRRRRRVLDRALPVLPWALVACAITFVTTLVAVGRRSHLQLRAEKPLPLSSPAASPAVEPGAPLEPLPAAPPRTGSTELPSAVSPRGEPPTHTSAAPPLAPPFNIAAPPASASLQQPDAPHDARPRPPAGSKSVTRVNNAGF